MSSDADSALRRLISAALGHLLARDANTVARLARLEGRLIALAVRDRGRGMTVAVRDGRIVLVDGASHAADVSIRGRPADFVALVRASQRGESLAAGRIEITGDLAIAQEVQGLIRELDVDPEELLSQWLGDVAAHRLARALRDAGGATARAGRRFESDVLEYLRHELRAVPTRAESERLGAEIFALADAVERAEARLRQLEARARGVS